MSVKAYGETPGASAPPPTPPRPPSRTSSSQSSFSMRESPLPNHKREPSAALSPRAYNLDEEVPGQKRLIEINQRLLVILAELKNYSEQIGNVQLGIERNTHSYENLTLLKSQVEGLKSSIAEAQTEYGRETASFEFEDRTNGFAWTKSHEWEPYEIYKTTCGEINEVLSQIKLPEMPSSYYQENIQRLNREIERLRNLSPTPPKKCCVIL